MAYIVTREVAGLSLKVGDELKHEKGKLPTALKFSAVWKDQATAEPEPEPKKTKAK